jgi:hypothetical protein
MKSGSEIFTSDTQKEKARRGISFNLEPGSNLKAASFEQPLKQESPILVVTLGRINDLSDEQPANAESAMVRDAVRGKNTTSVRRSQL